MYFCQSKFSLHNSRRKFRLPNSLEFVPSGGNTQRNETQITQLYEIQYVDVCDVTAAAVLRLCWPLSKLSPPDQIMHYLHCNQLIGTGPSSTVSSRDTRRERCRIVS
ncbi:hypothetical protein J6590_037600 [Homalodisca vitripennis]|nr:hypothetical protein J6590_037600 [Homalodisca vitripennis]